MLVLCQIGLDMICIRAPAPELCQLRIILTTILIWVMARMVECARIGLWSNGQWSPTGKLADPKTVICILYIYTVIYLLIHIVIIR